MSGPTSVNGEEIDKSRLYGRFLKSIDDNQEIYKDAVRMALDIPKQSGLHIEANTIHNYEGRASVVPGKKPAGALSKVLLGSALALGAGGLGLGALSLLRGPAVQEIERLLPGRDTTVEPGEMIIE